MQPGPIGEPGEGAGLDTSAPASAATMVPSFFAPILTSIDAPEVGPEPRNTSSRVITIFTGRPDLRDSATATRLQIDQRLAAEAAADFGRGHADVGDVHAEQLGACRRGP